MYLRFHTLRAHRKTSSANIGRRRSGAAVVELAVLLPLLVLCFVLAVDFARVFYFSLTLVGLSQAVMG